MLNKLLLIGLCLVALSSFPKKSQASEETVKWYNPVHPERSYQGTSRLKTFSPKELEKALMPKVDERVLNESIRLLAVAMHTWNPNFEISPTAEKIHRETKTKGALKAVVIPALLLLDVA